MKKVFLMFVMLAFTIASYAGDISKNVKVSSFDGLDISSYFDVTVSKGGKSSVNIIVDEELEPYIIVKVTNNVLRLGLDTDRMPRSLRNNNGNRTLEAQITMSSLRKLDVSGASRFYTADSFNENKFEGDFSGAAKVNGLSLTVSDADFDISGASSVDLSLKGVSNGSFDISGASNVSLDIDADRCEFDVSGASNLESNGRIDYLSAEASGASKCFFTGDAGSAEYDVSGASKISAEKMIVKDLKVDLSGASSISANVTESIEVEASGSSSLKYLASKDVNVIYKEVSKGVSITRK